MTVRRDPWQLWRMLAGLAAIIWAYIQFPGYRAGSGLTAALALAVTAAGWLGWAAYNGRGPSRPLTACVCLTGLAGSVLLCIDPSITVCWFTFWACVDAGAELPRRIGIGLAGTCCAILLAGRLLQDGDLLATFAAVAFVGYCLGMYRRQREQAATAAERNRIAGELHDILGHSLTALSLQVQTAAAALEVSGDVGTALTHLDRATQLTSGAREEAVAAVGALRDGAVGLTELTERLIASSGLTAELTVNGPQRPLSAAAGMAVYRLVQECLTNAGKHAPGAKVTVTFDYRPEALAVTVVNPACETAGNVAVSSGQGLRGMRERITAAGGTVVAGAAADGWRVRATVPA